MADIYIKSICILYSYKMMYSVTLVSLSILHIRLSAGVHLSHNNKWEERTDPNPIFPYILVAYAVWRVWKLNVIILQCGWCNAIIFSVPPFYIFGYLGESWPRILWQTYIRNINFMNTVVNCNKGIKFFSLLWFNIDLYI